MTNNMNRPYKFKVHSTIFKFNHITGQLDPVFNETNFFTTHYNATQHKKMLQEMQINGGYITATIEQIA